MGKRFRYAPFLFVAVFFILFGVSCGLVRRVTPWQQPGPITIRGGEMWTNLMPSWMSWMTAAWDGGAGGLLAREGDVLIGDEAWLVYRRSDGVSLETGVEDGRLLLSGKTVSLTLADPTGGWEWLEQASPDELRLLRFLAISGDVDESRIPILKKLAAVNPDLGLVVQSASVYASVAQYFRPRILFLTGLDPDVELGGLLASQKQIEILSLQGDYPDLDFLAELPNLRWLALSDWDPGKTGPLPGGMRALRSLLIVQSEFRDASALAGVPAELEELSIIMCEDFPDPSALGRFSNLRTLILNQSGTELTDLSAFRNLKKLAWVGLPPTISQNGLSDLTANHPDLKILELIRCDDISDLSPLLKLKSLNGLVLAGSYGDLDPVRGMKSLKFLGLPQDVFEESPQKISEFQAALPDALVVPSTPLCLGSGWILLVFPLTVLMRLAAYGIRRRRGTDP